MTGGIHIKPGTRATINGVDIQRVVDVAIGLAKLHSTGRRDTVFVSAEDTTDDESQIAKTAARLLAKLKAKGYSPDICRDALWAKIIDEAQRATGGPS